MTNEEIDRLMVEHIMGGFVSDPDALADVGEVWYWLHPKDGVLRGEPYQFKANRAWDHQWERWQPSRDIGAAWGVVERMREKGFRLMLADDLVGTKRTAFFIGGGYANTSYADQDTLVICIAALKAVGVEVTR